MYKLLTLVLLLFLSSSCGLTEGNVVEQPPSSTFSFVKIEYADGDDCRYYFDQERIASIDRFNYSEEMFTTTVYPHGRVYERCLFMSVDSAAFSFTHDSLKIKVPVSKAADGTLIFDKGEKWVYSKELQKMNPILDSVPPITVEPFVWVTMKPVYTTQTIDTAYKLYLRGNEMGEERIITGFIEHTTFIDFDILITRKPVDHIDTLETVLN